MDKLLLLMPQFMGYEKSLKKTLQKKYEVTWVNCDQFDQEVLARYKCCSKLRWGFRHICSNLKEQDQEKAGTPLKQELKEINLRKNYYAVIFCINGAFLSNTFYCIMKKRNPNARFIFYAWDDVNNLMKQSHIKFFDEIFTYNIQECKKYHWSYLPMFVQSEKAGHAETDQYDVMFLGSAHSDRQTIANKLYDKYSKQYKLFIYLYDPNHTRGRFCHDEPLTYEQYLEIMRESKTILDVPERSQKGPTTRSFDALLTETKVITTNTHIRHYPVYSRNIVVTDRNNIQVDDDFIKRPYEKNKYAPLTISKWLSRLGL